MGQDHYSICPVHTNVRLTMLARAVLFLVLLAFPRPVSAEESLRPFSIMSADQLSLDSGDIPLPVRSCPEPRLSPVDLGVNECWSRGIELAAVDDVRLAAKSAGESGSMSGETRPRRLLGALLAGVPLAATAANSTLGYNHRSFHIDNEGFFGAKTDDGGADKASHFADYHIAAKELTYLYQRLNYSEREALLMGFAVSSLAGLVNELGDGFTRHGFSPEDLVMDVLGAGTATLIGATRTGDLVGIRTSHLPGDTPYIHDVYAADLKLAGVARRLGVEVGPLRFLLLSVTYAAKGYKGHGPTADSQQQVGIEIGLNLEEILNAVGARRNSWWAYPLHILADNVRFPYLAVGFRYDMTHGKWRGPNNGNYP